MDLISPVILTISGFIIGFVGGLVGLVLGVVRFPVVLSIETSASVSAGTNLGVSTLGSITAALRHYRLGNVHFRLFLILGLTGACWSVHRILFNWNYADDRVPRLDEIQRIVEYPDWRIKAIVYTMVSSRIRLGAWDYLLSEHITPLRTVISCCENHCIQLMSIYRSSLCQLLHYKKQLDWMKKQYSDQSLPIIDHIHLSQKGIR